MTQIQFKKLRSLQLTDAQIKSRNADCFKNKTKDLHKRWRMLNSLPMLKPSAKKACSLSIHTLRQFWFCTNCLRIFHLKPIKKYKALQLFNLRCAHCHSCEVHHNRELTKAIAEQKPKDELLSICKEHGVEIEYEIKNNTKYFPVIINEKIAKADKEYFFLKDTI